MIILGSLKLNIFSSLLDEERSTFCFNLNLIIIYECHKSSPQRVRRRIYVLQGNAHEGERQRKKRGKKKVPFLGNSSLNRISFDTYQLIDNHRRSLQSALVTHSNDFFLSPPRRNRKRVNFRPSYVVGQNTRANCISRI